MSHNRSQNFQEKNASALKDITTGYEAFFAKWKKYDETNETNEPDYTKLNEQKDDLFNDFMNLSLKIGDFTDLLWDPNSNLNNDSDINFYIRANEKVFLRIYQSASAILIIKDNQFYNEDLDEHGIITTAIRKIKSNINTAKKKFSPAYNYISEEKDYLSLLDTKLSTGKSDLLEIFDNMINSKINIYEFDKQLEAMSINLKNNELISFDISIGDYRLAYLDPLIYFIDDFRSNLVDHKYIKPMTDIPIESINDILKKHRSTSQLNRMFKNILPDKNEENYSNPDYVTDTEKTRLCEIYCALSKSKDNDDKILKNELKPYFPIHLIEKYRKECPVIAQAQRLLAELSVLETKANVPEDKKKKYLNNNPKQYLINQLTSILKKHINDPTTVCVLFCQELNSISEDLEHAESMMSFFRPHRLRDFVKKFHNSFTTIMVTQAVEMKLNESPKIDDKLSELNLRTLLGSDFEDFLHLYKKHHSDEKIDGDKNYFFEIVNLFSRLDDKISPYLNKSNLHTKQATLQTLESFRYFYQMALNLFYIPDKQDNIKFYPKKINAFDPQHLAKQIPALEMLINNIKICEKEINIRKTPNPGNSSTTTTTTPLTSRKQ